MTKMLNKRPNQVVILAGGKGSRLWPLTHSIPKPMIRFKGNPFLEYLVEQVKEQGFEKILLLLGYLPNKIVEYFRDGRSFGISIDYSVTNVNFDTGKRLKLAKPYLDQSFLLMYCDNYWPMNFGEMWEHFQSKEVDAQITVYTNKDGYTRDNIRVNGSSIVEFYDKTRTADNLCGVDIGYAILKKEVIDLIPDENVNFEKSVYPKLVELHELAAYKTDHRYYSVGSHDRLPITETFMARRPAVILDRDGVVNVKQPKGHYVTKWDEFIWIPGSIEAIRLLKEKGYRVIIVTNQAGIARGMMTQCDLEDIHRAMQKELALQGASIDAIYVCPHGWNEGCECRKPNPGMLFNAQRDYHLDLSKTFFIGDDVRDLEAGERAGCITRLVAVNERLIDIVKDDILRTRNAVPFARQIPQFEKGIALPC